VHAGLDLSRKRVGVCVLPDDGELIARTASPPDADGLAHLVTKLDVLEQPIAARIESMTGARFVRDVLTEHGWSVVSDLDRELRRSGADHRKRAALADDPRRRLGLGLHDRRRDWRRLALCDAGEALRLERSLPARCPVG
jgi:hypothetical protein